MTIAIARCVAVPATRNTLYNVLPARNKFCFVAGFRDLVRAPCLLRRGKMRPTYEK